MARSLRVLTDSSALRKGKIQLSKISGKENPADLLTKYLPGVKVAAIGRALGFHAESGRTNIVVAAQVGTV